ncbi:MAG: FtsX-like permease family protein [Myxococcales bacterium]|nr:FtsX-like permease family protein [Myxococcales bacterium]
MMVIFFIIYVAVGLLLLNAMLMAVFERVREFGLLKALGVAPSRVLALIFLESGIQTAIAIAVSATIAIPAMWYLATRGIDVGVLAGTDMMGVTMRPIWYGVYNLETIRGPFISLFIIISLAVLYPARKAARLNPVQAMRHR